MLRSKPHVAVLILAFVVIAQRVSAGFGSRVVEPALGHDPPHGLNTHLRSASSLVLDDLDLEAGFTDMILIALAGDDVGRNPIMRKHTQRILVSTRAEFVDVEAERLARATRSA